MPVDTIASAGPRRLPTPLKQPDEGLEQQASEEQLLYHRDDDDGEHADDGKVRPVEPAGQAVGRGVELVLEPRNHVLERKVEAGPRPAVPLFRSRSPRERPTARCASPMSAAGLPVPRVRLAKKDRAEESHPQPGKTCDSHPPRRHGKTLELRKVLQIPTHRREDGEEHRARQVSGCEPADRSPEPEPRSRGIRRGTMVQRIGRLACRGSGSQAVDRGSLRRLALACLRHIWLGPQRAVSAEHRTQSSDARNTDEWAVDRAAVVAGLAQASCRAF